MWFPALALTVVVLLWWWCATMVLRCPGVVEDADPCVDLSGPREEPMGVSEVAASRVHVFAGWLTAAETFRRIASALPASCGRVVFHGFSRRMDHPCDLIEGGGSVCLVGYSMGCRSALWTALHWPVSAVVLLAPVMNLSRDVSRAARILQMVGRGLPDAVRWWILRVVAHGWCGVSFATMDARWQRLMDHVAVSSFHRDPWIDVPRLVRGVRRRGSRVVVMRADRDEIAHWNAADWVHADRVVRLPGAGHDIPRTHAGAIAEVIRRELSCG